VLSNVDRAIHALRGEDPAYTISVASPYAPSLPVDYQSAADATSLHKLIQGLAPKIDEDDLLVVYVTGHGWENTI